MTRILNARLQKFDTPGSLGVVADTTYVRCFWPRLDRPTELFAAGSSGIQVEGPPTPRNVVFPAGTVFLGGTRPDCMFLTRERKVEREIVREVAELTPKETVDLRDGVVTEANLRASKTFVNVAN